MKTTIGFFILTVVWFTGCEPVGYRDLTPPTAPRGIYTYTGDDMIELVWRDNPERDLAGYRVYVSPSSNGTYRFIGSSGVPRFVDYGARNGNTYYYAVTAYDLSENESELSREVVYDTPRPEGYDVALRDYRAVPNEAGYDFSTYSIGPYDDQYTDIFFEYYNGVYYMNVWEDTDIQGMGYTSSLYDVGYAPENGWSPTKDVRLYVGHTYVVWTWDNHYAKFRVTSLSSTRVVLDWAYQLQEGNPRLKPSAQNGRNMQLGSGARERRNAQAVR
jgi:hypothetical protein